MMESLRISIERSWKGTSKDGNQFLWRRNLEGEVMSELQTLDFILFFIFACFFLLGLGFKYDIMVILS